MLGRTYLAPPRGSGNPSHSTAAAPTAWEKQKTNAARGEMAPRAMGRFLVRLTFRSYGASIRSFQAWAALEKKKLPGRRTAKLAKRREEGAADERIADKRAPKKCGKNIRARAAGG